jgi:hypothetical protein
VITPLDIRIILIHGEPYEAAALMARRAEIGGRSQIRTSGARFTSLAEDQLVGMLGHYAASVALYGNSDPYFEARAKANADPYRGDGGVDLPGEVDVKASLIRKVSRRLGDYYLPVRPAELHEEHRYVLALVRMYEDSAAVRLMGWCRGSDLPRQPCVQEGHPLKGAHILPARALLPLRMLQDQLQGEGHYRAATA